MRLVSILEAKSLLSCLVALLEQGKEREIVIVRNDRPVAKLVPIDTAPAGQRLGIAKGKFEVPDIDAHDEGVAQRFMGEK